MTDGTPTAEDWAAFLRPLLHAVHNPPDAEGFRKRIAAIAFAAPQVRRSMLTKGVQREMVATCKHWPTAAEVVGFFRDAIAHERALLEYRERPLLMAPEAKEKTPEQIAAVRAKAAEAIAALRGGTEGARPAVKPAYLSGEQLAQVRRKLGIKPLARVAPEA